MKDTGQFKEDPIFTKILQTKTVFCCITFSAGYIQHNFSACNILVCICIVVPTQVDDGAVSKEYRAVI